MDKFGQMHLNVGLWIRHVTLHLYFWTMVNTKSFYLGYVRRNLTSSHSKSVSLVRINNHWIQTRKLGAVSGKTSHHVSEEFIKKLEIFTAKTKTSKKKTGCELISISHFSWLSVKTDLDRSKSRKKVTFFYLLKLECF